MEYITRDLQHKTREILDKAMLAPVRIRRGGDFFEITKIKFGNLVESEKIPQKIVENDPIYIDDSQEYTESDGSAVGDLIASGLLTKGVK